MSTTSAGIQDAERVAVAIMRAEAAENRLLRATTRFCLFASVLNTITAARHGSAIIAGVESRNELGEMTAGFRLSLGGSCGHVADRG